MSRNSAGTYSLPSGNPVVSGTTVSSTWANTTLTDLANEMSNSLDRNGHGAMLAPIQVQDGTGGAPSYTFQNEPSSGLYRAASNDIRGSIGGTDVIRLTASGVIIPQLQVGANHILLAGGNPGSSTAFGNTLTPKNTPKAWATIKTDGSGGVSILDGFNVASVTLIANTTVRLTFAQLFTSANYAVAAMAAGTYQPVPAGLSGSVNKSTTLCDIQLRNLASSAALLTNLNATVYEFYVQFFGAN